METIELEEGWLVRQMTEVRREAESWPEVMKPITTINASLVHQPSTNNPNPIPQSRQAEPTNSRSEK
jgi:hypothetical protein